MFMDAVEQWWCKMAGYVKEAFQLCRHEGFLEILSFISGNRLN